MYILYIIVLIFYNAYMDGYWIVYIIENWMLKFFYYSFLFIIGIISFLAIISLSILWNYGNDLPDYTQLKSYKTINFLCPRLPRLKTDQTLSILDHKSELPFRRMLK